MVAAVFPLTLFLSFEQLLRIITLQRGDANPAPERPDDRTDTAPGTGREQVAALLDAEARAGRDPSALTGPLVAQATGLSVRRAQELLAELRAPVRAQARTAGAGMRGGEGR
jgi:hypothetical protein